MNLGRLDPYFRRVVMGESTTIQRQQCCSRYGFYSLDWKSFECVRLVFVNLFQLGISSTSRHIYQVEQGTGSFARGFNV